MNKITVLVEGYARPLPNGGWQASSTTTLVTSDSGLKIIVDPGCNQSLLLQKLTEKNLAVEDINLVFLTHYHPDHALLAHLFAKAKLSDGQTIYSDDLEEPYSDELPGTGLRVVYTPGHAAEHSSLLVSTEEWGKVAVAGDVFWWTTEEKQEVRIDKPDELALDMEFLKESRKKLLKLADWIIPGHGKMWKVER